MKSIDVSTKRSKTNSMIVAAAIAVSTLFAASCSEKKSEEPKITTITTMDIKYTLHSLEEIHEYETVNVSYTDANNKTQTEEVSLTPWSKEVKGVTFPFTGKIEVRFTRKAGVTFTKACIFGGGCSFFFRPSSEVGYFTAYEIFGNRSVSVDKVAGHLSYIENNPEVYQFTFEPVVP